MLKETEENKKDQSKEFPISVNEVWVKEKQDKWVIPLLISLSLSLVQITSYISYNIKLTESFVACLYFLVEDFFNGLMTVLNFVF